jgi:hypothetical protein
MNGDMPETVSKNKTPSAAPKKKRISATEIKRKKVVKKILDNTGKSLSVSAAMREVGYSPSYAKTPGDFLNTKATTDLLEQYFPDDLLHAKTRELMEASEIDSFVFPLAKNKAAKGKDKKLTNEEVKFIVEQVAGCTLIYIRDSDFPPGRIAFFRSPALKARKDGLEMAYKLKGAFKADATNPEDRNPFSKMSDEELAAAIKEAKDVLRKK